MATLDVFNLKREKVGSIDLADEVFASEVKEHLFYEVVKAQLASRRAGTAGSKNRSAVAGSTKKSHQAEGHRRRAPRYHPCADLRRWAVRRTGPARVTGRTGRPRQVRIGALRSALSKFNKEGRLVVVDSFTLSEIKIKGVLTALASLEDGQEDDDRRRCVEREPSSLDPEQPTSPVPAPRGRERL